MNLESAINVDRISSDRRPSGKKFCLRIHVLRIIRECSRVSGISNKSTVDVSVAFRQIVHRKIRIRMRIIRKCDCILRVSNKSTGVIILVCPLIGFGRNQILIFAIDIDHRSSDK